MVSAAEEIGLGNDPHAQKTQCDPRVETLSPFLAVLLRNPQCSLLFTWQHDSGFASMTFPSVFFFDLLIEEMRLRQDAVVFFAARFRCGSSIVDRRAHWNSNVTVSSRFLTHSLSTLHVEIAVRLDICNGRARRKNAVRSAEEKSKELEPAPKKWKKNKLLVASKVEEIQ